jgi:hypothetical protein
MSIDLLRAARTSLAGAISTTLLAACTTLGEPEGPPRKETMFAVTAGLELIRFNTGQPGRILERKPLQGLASGDTLVGIDFRVARGVLYALSRQGLLYTVDTASGRLTRVGQGPLALPLSSQRFGFDFNPAADRIRVVGDNGFNLRLHPDTGAVVDGDPARDGVQADAALTYVKGDTNEGRSPQVLAAAYTYNKQDDKLTTNYAIDSQQGTLVMQGSREGAAPVVSPNSGRLSTVGALGTGPLEDASFDIADLSNAAFAAVRTASEPRTRLLLVDLASGRTQALGTVGDGSPLLGIAVEP